MLVLEKSQNIFKVEIMNNGIDWISFIETLVSVFLGALLAYIFTKMIEKKKDQNQKREIFVNSLIDRCNNIYIKSLQVMKLQSQILIEHHNDVDLKIYDLI